MWKQAWERMMREELDIDSEETHQRGREEWLP